MLKNEYNTTVSSEIGHYFVICGIVMVSLDVLNIIRELAI